jgi:uncharacterized protein (DUF952 family)
MTLVYKVCSVSEWEEANKTNFFLGSAIDIKDGFIHLSTKDQLEVTVSKHFAGQTKLLLIGFDIKVIKSSLKWEKSRDGDLFPHFYGKINVNLANEIFQLNLGMDGFHKFPENFFTNK